MSASPLLNDRRCLTVPVPSGRLAVWQVGAGPDVVLVHGGTSTAQTDWQSVLPYLSERFRVTLFDHRGHGRSLGFDAGIGMERFGLDLLLVMRFLGIDAAALVGFSVGGNSLLKLLARRPEVARALVTIGSAARGEPERVRKIMSGPWLEALVELEHGEAQDADHWMRIREALAHDWATDLQLSGDEVARIDCPALICHGDGDRIQTLEQALELARLLPASQLFVVPRAGHMAQVDRPDLVGPALVEFLGQALEGPG